MNRPRRACGEDHRQIAEAVRRAGSSFYWAMRLMSREHRHALFAIYGFCRAVDDIADEGTDREAQRTALARWRKRITALAAGEAGENPLERALAEAIDRFALEPGDLEGVIEGMEMDVEGPVVAPSLEEFDRYLDRVACAVGRLCVRVFGAPWQVGRALAEHQGRALQITNILRDVEEDAHLGRLYLPGPLLERYGIDSRDPLQVVRHPALKELKLGLAKRAAAEFSAARATLAECTEGDMRAARIMLEVYEDRLYRMIREGFVPETAGRSARWRDRLRKLAIALRVVLGGRKRARQAA